MTRGASRIVGVRLPETLAVADVGLGSAPLTHPTSLRGVSGVEPRSSVVRESTKTYFKYPIHCSKASSEPYQGSFDRGECLTPSITKFLAPAKWAASIGVMPSPQV
jgi:hypothetical protein